MRVYYYTAEEYALSNIINERIKISLLEDLNDPFEFVAVDLSDENFREMYKPGMDGLAKQAGMISFSREKDNLLMWSHYGDKHRGICLGFDVDNEHIKEVDYFSKRIPFDLDMDEKHGGMTINLLIQILKTKYVGWEYENEVRVIVPLKEKDPSGFYFTDFKGNLELKEIILGVRSKLEIKQVAKYLCSYKNTVKIVKTQIAQDDFKIIIDESVPEYVHSA